MSKKYDLAVYIGRFQPFHNGHKYVIEEANKIARKVVVLIGSSRSSRSTKNPFTMGERYGMIVDSGVKVDYVLGLADSTYEENQWLTEVQDLVEEVPGDNPNVNICIIGHTKDESSYYLKNFPQWDQVNLEHWEAVDATKIRDIYFAGATTLFLKGIVPDNVVNFLSKFKETDTYTQLFNEYKAVKDYKKLWAGSPFPNTFNTVDAVVVQSGHILLIKRGDYPGKGLWALPGGFLGEFEEQQDAAIRELREETKLKVPIKVLVGSITKEKTFAGVNRSTRGRTITQVFLFQLDNAQELPKVKGSDDAVFAKWFTLSDFYAMEEEIYEDHMHIVRALIDNT